MKGILSEVELHTLRGRLLAGVQTKARRGELQVPLPTGLVRLQDGRVVKDPNQQVQKAIELVFASFLQLKSVGKVLRALVRSNLRLPRRQREETRWVVPEISALRHILNNPAYSGTFVYGRTQWVSEPHGVAHIRHRPKEQWSIVVKDRYEAYISWETFERIQAMMRENALNYKGHQTRGIPREGVALLQGLAYCGQCGHKMGVQYKKSPGYGCDDNVYVRGTPWCQRILPAGPLDQVVVEAFLQALQPVELDLVEQALQAQQQQCRDIQAAQERELTRLRYEAELARRQYDRVDPDNRLVAAELERRWETALQTFQQTQQRFEQEHQSRQKESPFVVSAQLRSTFHSLGTSLPSLWASNALSRSQRKALLRCLIDKVVLARQGRDHARLRIVWKGDAVSEWVLPLTVGSLKDLSNVDELQAQVMRLYEQGLSDRTIAQKLTEQGFRSPKRATLLPSSVQEIRKRHHGLRRRGWSVHVPGFLSISQLAKALGLTRPRIHYLIRLGLFQSHYDAARDVHLFPDQPELLEELRQRDLARRQAHNRPPPLGCLGGTTLSSPRNDTGISWGVGSAARRRDEGRAALF